MERGGWKEKYGRQGEGELQTLPENIGKLRELICLNLSGCSNICSLPCSIGNLTKLTSLDLTGCENLRFLPETVGNLTKLTSLHLGGCSKLVSLPISLSHLTHLTTPLCIAGIFPLPSNMDRNVTVPLYLEYMMRMDKTGLITSCLREYVKRFDPFHYPFKGYQISDVYALIERRGGGTENLIKHLCSMLTNGRRRTRKGDKKRIMEGMSEKKRRDGMGCLKILHLNVCGLAIRQENKYPFKEVYTKRRIRDVWKDEGRNPTGKKEWERRWREGRDIMEEEDVVEVAVMHLSIPAYTKKEKDELTLPSVCSYDALVILHNKISQREYSYHFPVYDINTQPSNAVIIRNLPSHFRLDWIDGYELRSMIKSIQRVVVEQARNEGIVYPVVRVKMKSREDAKRVVEEMRGQKMQWKPLIVSVGVKDEEEMVKKKERRTEYSTTRN